MTLHYSHTSWLTYKSKLGPLIASSKAIVAHQIAVHSAHTKLIKDGNGAQNFLNSLHNGIDLQIENIQPYTITWGDTRDVLWGLELTCCLQLCRFEFSVESGTRIGKGLFSKA